MKRKIKIIYSKTILFFAVILSLISFIYIPWFYIKTEKNHIPWFILSLVFISVFSFLFYSFKYKVKINKNSFENEFIKPSPNGDLMLKLGDLDLDPIAFIISIIIWIFASFLFEFIILFLFSSTLYLVGGLLIGLNWIIFNIYKLMKRKIYKLNLNTSSIIFFSLIYSLLITTWLGILLIGPRYLLN